MGPGEVGRNKDRTHGEAVGRMVLAADSCIRVASGGVHVFMDDWSPHGPSVAPNA